MPVTWLLLAGGVTLGAAAGVLAHRTLQRARYRLEDERDLPRRGTLWLPPAVAATVGLVAVGWWGETPLLAVVLACYTVVLAVLTAIDLDVRRLPDRITLPLIPATAAAVGLVTVVAADYASLGRALLGGVALGAFYFAQVIVARGNGMGLGDVKLSVSLGILLGCLSWSHVLLATACAYLTALLVGVFLILFRGGNRRTLIAFGPHMALGAVAVIVAPGVAHLVGAV